MSDTDLFDIFSGQYEQELTEELMQKLVDEKVFPNIEVLRDAKKCGFVWNAKRKSLMLNLNWDDL